MNDEEFEQFETTLRCLLECREYSEEQEKLKEIMENIEIYRKVDKVMEILDIKVSVN